LTQPKKQSPQTKKNSNICWALKKYGLPLDDTSVHHSMLLKDICYLNKKGRAYRLFNVILGMTPGCCHHLSLFLHPKIIHKCRKIWRRQNGCQMCC
jgi:hypothetical protein